MVRFPLGKAALLFVTIFLLRGSVKPFKDLLQKGFPRQSGLNNPNSNSYLRRMHIEVLNSLPNDIDTIFDFYDMAIAHQKKVFNKHWQGFSRQLVEAEIAENRQYKISVKGEVACVFAVTFNDKLIWGDRDHDSIYIHRIVTHPNFRGYAFVKEIIKWAKVYAAKNKIKYIRMDTWADNEKLLAYYTACGFDYVGIVTMEQTDGLPKHYEGISLSLFEIVV